MQRLPRTYPDCPGFSRTAQVSEYGCEQGACMKLVHNVYTGSVRGESWARVGVGTGAGAFWHMFVGGLGRAGTLVHMCSVQTSVRSEFLV